MILHLAVIPEAAGMDTPARERDGVRRGKTETFRALGEKDGVEWLEGGEGLAGN